MPDAPHHNGSSQKEQERKFGQTVLEDLNVVDFRRSMHQDLKEIYQFYLDDKTRAQLADLGPFRRSLFVSYWLLRNSILKLSPTRRLLLLIGIVVFLYGLLGPLDVFSIVVGFVVVLLMLLLELKDKLLAQDELATGRAVQFALLPKQNPRLPGWEIWMFTRPANEVGGDLIDYLELPGDRLALALGDVAGKGLGAALVMAKLQSTLRAIAAGYSSLSDLAAEVNAIFCRDGLPSRFVSLVYLELTAQSDQVRLTNAGHLPPLVVSRDAINELSKGGPALGLMSGASFEEQVLHLEPGELLIVYSDGLTEARSERGDFFDRRRLLEIASRLRGLSAEAAGMRLLHTIDRFMDEAPPSDDLLLIVIRRHPASDPEHEAGRRIQNDASVA